MRKSLITLIAVTEWAALAACATDPTYVATGKNMDVHQAEYVMKSALSGGRLAATDTYYRITEAKLRSDGVGFLWIKGRDPGLLAPDLVYDTAPQLKVCYYSRNSDAPSVEHILATKVFIVHGLCDAGIWFDSLSEAKDFADALYVLEHNGN